MIDTQYESDKATEGGFLLTHERELLKHEAETIRTFYSLTGAPRKDYIIQMAEAEAERIRIIRQAEADGILAIRKAEAEGLKMIDDALANASQPELLKKILTLETAQNMARSLADGKATKLFLPQSLGEVFSVLGVLKELQTHEESESKVTSSPSS